MFKKQVDKIKKLIERELSDEDICSIFEPKNGNVDFEKAKVYMNSVLMFALEERYEEAMAEKTEDEEKKA